MNLGSLATEGMAEIVGGIAASAAVVATDAATITACNGAFRAMIGLSRDGRGGLPLRDVMAADVAGALRSQIAGCLEKVAPVERVHPFHSTGPVTWWRITAQPVVDSSGAPAAALLTCLDVSGKVRLEQALEDANSRFSAVIQSAYDGIITIDADHRITLFNAAAESMFGYSAEEVLGQPLSILVPPRVRERHEEHLATFSKSAIGARTMFERNGPIYGRRKDGSEYPVEVSISKIVVQGATEFAAVVRDVSERARLIEQLRSQANLDNLTGLFNRRAFYQQAEHLISQARQRGRPLSLLMGDVDHFKRINDRYGHAGGDCVLKIGSREAMRAFRKGDLVARLGGEEFAALLPDTDEEEAAGTAERVRRLLEDCVTSPLWAGREPIPFTMSIGVASLRVEDVSVDGLLRRADKALYAAKHAGRNRVRRWSEALDRPAVGSAA